MLDVYIIDAIQEQERARQESGQIHLEMPNLAGDRPERLDGDHQAPEDERGVIVIPLYPPVSDSEDAA